MAPATSLWPGLSCKKIKQQSTSNRQLLLELAHGWWDHHREP
jgi:hypothetical protein